MNEKKQASFIMYHDYAKYFNQLSLEDRGALISAVFEFAIDGETTVELTPAAQMVLMFITDQMKRDAEKYLAICLKNRENGGKGGRPTKPQSETERFSQKTKITERFSQKPKKPDNDNDNDNDNENDNDHIKKRRNRAEGEGENKSFDVFWKAYPKKQAKPQAVKAFEKVNPSPEVLDSMLKAIEEQKRSVQWQKDEGQFIPLPSTWLNQRRWEDESTVIITNRDETPEEFFAEALKGAI